MEYKVIPFSVSVSSKEGANSVAGQVESQIQSLTNQGWTFVSCGNIDTHIQGSSGCFGIGARPASQTSVMVLVFKK
jgi:hypothetical protein